MGCPDEDELLAVAEGRASSAGRAATVLHLQTCDSCREVVGSIAKELDGDTLPTLSFQDGPLVAPGGQVSRYGVVEMLGQGGMSEVYLAHDPQLDRKIAIKMLRPGPPSRLEVTVDDRRPAKPPSAPRVARLAQLSRSQLEPLRPPRDLPGAVGPEEELGRFLREAQIQGQLEHPSIVPVHELGVSADGTPFFTMKRIRGVTLKDIVDALGDDDPEAGRRFGRHRLLTAFLSICQAVEYAHSHGWIHRDLKPANIMLGDFGEVYVLDWGLARYVGSVELPGTLQVDLRAVPVGATTPGAMLGTPGYMAPEQVDGHPADVRSDVYALGAVLFELLTHQSLATGSSVMELLDQTRAGVDARARIRAPDREVSPELEAICLKATQRKAVDRQASVRELHDAVERVLSGERNLELRADLANIHAEAGRAAAERVGSGSDDIELRRTALREVGQALTLDPTHRVALQTLIALMTQAPARLPPEAIAELEAGRATQLRTAARAATLGILAIMVELPVVISMGVRQLWMMLVSYGLAVGAAMAAGYAGYFKKTPSRAVAVPTLILTSLSIGFVSLMTSPFMVVPALAAVNTMAFILVLDRRYRRLTVALGIGSVLLPVIGTLLGWMPETFRFVPEGILMVPQALELPRTPSLVLLTFASVATIGIAALVVGYVRDRFDELERRRAVQSWNVRQLLPPDVVPRPDPSRRAP